MCTSVCPNTKATPRRERLSIVDIIDLSPLTIPTKKKNKLILATRNGWCAAVAADCELKNVLARRVGCYSGSSEKSALFLSVYLSLSLSLSLSSITFFIHHRTQVIRKTGLHRRDGRHRPRHPRINLCGITRVHRPTLDFSSTGDDRDPILKTTASFFFFLLFNHSPRSLQSCPDHYRWVVFSRVPTTFFTLWFFFYYYYYSLYTGKWV